jgi:N,N'-diacetyllegionaminate synthase
MEKIQSVINLKNKSTYIVAEIGINHNGDIELAKKMIDAAKKAGADAVKFQNFRPDEIFAKENLELYNLVNKWALNKKDLSQLKNYAIKTKIEFFSTPFGKDGVKNLEELKVKAIKIASSDLDNFQLLDDCIKVKIPLIISTGMSTVGEIFETVEYLKEKKAQFMLLHCISCYPTIKKDANLTTIRYLKEIFQEPIGYSDHTLGIEACVAAVTLGAKMVEKHFTIDNNLEGPDQKISSNPIEFKKMVKGIRSVEKLLGEHRTNIYDCEIPFRNNMRKSVHAKKNLKKGERITKSMLTLVRPKKDIPPKMLDNITGMKVKRNIKKGSPITWLDF